MLPLLHKTPDEVTLPLVVDVEGSLVSGNLLVEGAARLLSRSPLTLFTLLMWSVVAIVGGRAALKRRIAQAMPLPPATLVLNPAVTEEIAAARAAGREVWLTSSADELVVAPLVEVVGGSRLLRFGRPHQSGRSKEGRSAGQAIRHR